VSEILTTPDEDRRSPLVLQIVLITCFALLVVASVFTVLIPELSDAGDEQRGAQNAEDEQEASPEEDDDGAAESDPDEP
jgi:hypothetical protein